MATTELDVEQSGVNNSPNVSQEQNKQLPPSTPIERATHTSAPSELAMSYVDMYKTLNPYVPPTEEELAKERKKQKRDQMFAAIGDGISALSNLYFTTQGAPNMYTGKNTASERTQIRYDKLQKERQDNNYAYYNGMIRAKQADEAKGRDERNWKQTLADFGIRERAQTRLEADAETRKNIGEARVGLYEAQQNKDDAMSEFYKAKAQALEDGAPLDDALKVARIAKEKALAKRAGTSESGSGEFRAYDRNGKERYFKSSKAQESFARQEGTWNAESSTSTSVKSTPIGDEKVTTTKTSGGTSMKPEPYKNTQALGL
ncbi:MAG: hypothetical protein RSA66_08720 [Muribaculaceae bacterium]